MQSKVSKRPRSLEQEAAKGCDGDHFIALLVGASR
jgi:hypothetical protein